MALVGECALRQTGDRHVIFDQKQRDRTPSLPQSIYHDPGRDPGRFFNVTGPCPQCHTPRLIPDFRSVKTRGAGHGKVGHLVVNSRG